MRPAGLPAHRGPDRSPPGPLPPGPSAPPRLPDRRSCCWRLATNGGATVSSHTFTAHLLLPAHGRKQQCSQVSWPMGCLRLPLLPLSSHSTCCCWASERTSCCSAPSSISTSILTRWWGPQWVRLYLSTSPAGSWYHQPWSPGSPAMGSSLAHSATSHN